MLLSRKEEWPKPGDLVMATVKDIVDYGAYVELDEYANKKGLLHVSEISSSWVRNIRSFVREDQKVVLKVLRVDEKKGHINLSLRRVTEKGKREKNKAWKRRRKAKVLLQTVADRVEMPPEEVYEKAGLPMEKEYGLYEAFEEVVKGGKDVLTEIGMPDNLAEPLAEIAKERVSIPLVKVRGIVEVSCRKPNGVEVIREAFAKSSESQDLENVELRFYVVSPPRYRIEVMAETYKRAESVLGSVAENVISSVTEVGGEGSFQREE